MQRPGRLALRAEWIFGFGSLDAAVAGRRRNFGGQSPVRLRGRDRSVYLRNVRHAEHRWRAPNCRSTATRRERW